MILLWGLDAYGYFKNILLVDKEDKGEPLQHNTLGFLMKIEKPFLLSLGLAEDTNAAAVLAILTLFLIQPIKYLDYDKHTSGV